MSFVDIGIVWPRGRGSETFEEDVREVFFGGGANNSGGAFYRPN